MQDLPGGAATSAPRRCRAATWRGICRS